jgi:hypothetical protein
VLGAVAVYGVLGLFVAPPIARKLIVDNFSQRLGRKVTLDDVSANPYTLHATARGLRIYEPDGRTVFASLADFGVAISPASLYRWAPIVNELSIGGLDVHLVRDGDNHYNVSDVLERLAKSPAETGPGPHEKARFSLSNIRLARANVDFDDKPRGVHHHVTDMQLAIPFISNLPGEVKELVKPSFFARVNGAPLELHGESLPFESDMKTRVSFGIDAVNLPTYVAYAPSGLPVNLSAGKLDAKVVVRFDRSPRGDPAIDVGGTVALSGIDVAGAEPVGRGHVDRLELDVASFDPLAGKGTVRLVRASGITAHGGEWRVPLTQAESIDVDLHDRKVVVGQALTRGGDLSLVRAADGTIEGLKRTSNSTESSAAPAQPWSITVAKAAIDDYRVAFTDQGVKPAVTHRAAIEHVTATNLSNAPDAKAEVDAKVALQSGGRVQVKSSIALSPLSVEAAFDARSLDLAPLKPYAAHFATVALKSAKASARGTVTLQGSGDSMKIAYKGGAELADLATYDTVNHEELVDWKSVRARGIDVKWSQRSPLRLAVDDIDVDGAYARVVVTPDGHINLQTLKFATAEDPSPAPQDPATLKPRDVRIGRIVFTGSRLDFADHFIKPNYSADIGNLAGSVTGLSSEPAARGKVDLHGTYADKSPITIAGEVNPLSGDLYLEIAAKGSDIELPQFSAYAARYAGYGITGGKLNLDVDYHVEHGKLVAKNGIVLDQLAFGDKVESPEATKLPVLFAVNLLKDSEGKIKVDLPISGSLDDPQFDVGTLVTQVFGNLLKKAVTSPFSLLSAAFGDSKGKDSAAPADDLAHVDFAAGDAKLDDRDRRKIAELSQALAQRPALKLALEPRVDSVKDAEALKAAGVKVDDAALKALAARRAEAVKEALAAKIPAERLIVADSSAAGEPGVALSLR